MSSIHDLARATGVSTATVSRALRGLPGVSQETRERVIAAAVELGYAPSPQAAGLASGSTRTVAIVSPYITRWYFATAVSAAEEVLRAEGYDVLLYNLSGDPLARTRVLGTQALTKRVDAVLIVGLSPTPEETAWLQTIAKPVVLLGSRHDVIPGVSIDDREVIRVAMAHLHDLGHRAVAYVGGMAHDGLEFSTPLTRLRAYRESVAELGLVADPCWELEGRFSTVGGTEAGAELLRLDRRPTAVMCASDDMAIGVLHELRGAGVVVPRDLSVIGVDDHALSRYFDLSTVRQPVEEQGRVAAAMLLRRLAGEDPHPGVMGPGLLLGTELVLRGTTARPAAVSAGRTSPGTRPRSGS